MDELDRYGTSFSYTNVLKEQPEVHEYAAITIADPSELLATAKDMIARLGYFEGTATSAFALTQKSGSTLINASLQVLDALGDSNTFKESAGYIQEHWRHLDKVLMKVRIEPAPIGKYKIIFVGKLIRSTSNASKQAAGAIVQSKSISQSLGSAKTSWLDGGFTRRGRDGFGGAKRMFLTSASNFKSGMKIGAIGTVIDLMLDVKAVFGENGSKDFSEFVGRAGVSIAKAGATAALGGLFAAVSMTILFTGGVARTVGGVSVVVVTAPEQPLGPAFARTLGIDCPSMKYIAVKSSAHFRSGFERFAGTIINVDAAATHTHDFKKLVYKNRTRPVFPVEIPPRR